MRVVVYGVGGVGGAIAAALALTGQEVVGIARGAMLEALQSHGLRLIAPGSDRVATFPVVAHPSEITFRDTDVVVMCMKTQHSLQALQDLRDAGVTTQPVFCAQNGVENERLALRLFPNVHGVTVMLPATYLTPGEVLVHSGPSLGIFDIGRYPSGADDADHTLAEALTAAGIQSFVDAEVMASKYGKLLVNLNGVIQAALGPGVDTSDLRAALQAEAEAVYRVAGIAWRDVWAYDTRRDVHMSDRDIPGKPRAGASSTQSLLRDTGSIETDYLNGEIVLLGALHGVPTPLNGWFLQLAPGLVRDGVGRVSREDIRAALGL